jgi:hypothetical protein
VSGEDLLPDLMIGRLPAQTASEAEAMVDKILQYEQTPPAEAWHTNVLLVADDAEASWELIFEHTAEELASLLPQGYTANKVYADHYPPGDPTADITHYINSGSLLVSYSGHGDVSGWGLSNAGGPLFDLDDVRALANAHKLPAVAIANCLSGFFTGTAERPSMAEVFLRVPNTGAVAVWAPASLGFASEHRLLMVALYKAIFQDGQSGLGAATTTAKLAAYSQNSALGESVETYVLFGDPATRLGLPPASTAQRASR